MLSVRGGTRIPMDPEKEYPSKAWATITLVIGIRIFGCGTLGNQENASWKARRKRLMAEVIVLRASKLILEIFIAI